eukprot:CAMPEP_0178458576 /NCGR_PEP_ID=MMETSP0689_2-20121128/47617_1 /TAXON_ID=160604 /ORGANISM="Amphidinium massartii, Strain CS-259" /LENGTH=904 /DNA_ID=CAMNT_0020084889 /DNA_START=75 /DNA_END=2788 /DNA_ORIENTATION=-
MATATSSASGPRLWKVVGGAQHGGILVRSSRSTTQDASAPLGRLSVGAVVREVEEAAPMRLRYELVSGQGPPAGWVTMRLNDKDLLELLPAELSAVCCALLLTPLGEIAYPDEENQEGRLHAECLAQRLMQRTLLEEECRCREQNELKAARKKSYGIGWQPTAESQLLHSQCLSFDAASGKLQLTPTSDASACVNPDYLALALKVKKETGKEPLFSLDPMSLQSSKEGLLRKRYEPSWLAGTCMGEVLFQADYLLKELSMGEGIQPVVGMQSALDFEVEEEEGRLADSSSAGSTSDWIAREWFVVGKAEVCLASDGVLVPKVSLGVEARELFVDEEHGQLEDISIVTPHHPLARYARQFTENFELIAERRRVVRELREVSKACVMAKALLDAGVGISQVWWDRADELVSLRDTALLAEAPQTWNDQLHAEVTLEGGKIVDGRGLRAARRRCLYGGIALRAQLPPLEFPPIDAALVERVNLEAAGVIKRGATEALNLSALAYGERFATMPVAAPGAAALLLADEFPPSTGEPLPAVRALGIPASAPLGVDLALDEFNLSEFTQPVAENGEEKRALHPCSPDVFPPQLSDWQPPAGESISYSDTTHVRRLHRLVQEEKARCQLRRERFLSPSFCQEEAADLFPKSWDWSSACLSCGSRCPLDDYRYSANVDDLGSPVFVKTTEDAVRFAIYRLCGVEVRLVEDMSTAASAPRELRSFTFPGDVLPNLQLLPTAPASAATRHSAERRHLARVMQFVERRTHEEGPRLEAQEHVFHYFVVLQTLSGDFVVTEARDQQISWQENPTLLAARCSFARMLRSVDCQGATVDDLKGYYDRAVRFAGVASAAAGNESSRRFSSEMYARAVKYAKPGRGSEIHSTTSRSCSQRETRAIDQQEELILRTFQALAA